LKGDAEACAREAGTAEDEDGDGIDEPEVQGEQP